MNLVVFELEDVELLKGTSFGFSLFSFEVGTFYSSQPIPSHSFKYDHVKARSMASLMEVNLR